MSLKNDPTMTDAEWQTRVELAACYRLMAHYGMTDLIYNHITARIPNADTTAKEHIVINAYGYLYEEITASNLITAVIVTTSTCCHFHFDQLQ